MNPKLIFKLLRFEETINKIKMLLVCFLLYDLFCNVNILFNYIHVLVFSFLSLSYTYVINDLHDIEIDKIAGKDRGIHHLSKNNAYIFVFSLLAICILYYFIFFEFNNISLFFLILLIFFSTFYSANPIRFKEKCFSGIVVGNLAMRSLIFLAMIFAITTTSDLVLISFFAIANFLLGMMTFIGHQISDIDDDKKAGVKTWATETNDRVVHLINKIFIALYIATLFAFPMVFYNRLFELFIISIIFLTLSIETHYFRHLGL